MRCFRLWAYHFVMMASFGYLFCEEPLPKEGDICKLNQLQSHLSLHYGNFKEEYPEQLMAVRFINPNATVLELGGNIGRNSCIIGSLLSDSKRLVVIESSPSIAQQLKENRDLNHLSFNIEVGAISTTPLIQREWDTIPSEVVLPGYLPVTTFTFNDLKKKYNIQFDTLVLDCEGAFYYILKNEPNILENIKTIIMENDYKDYSQFQYVTAELKQRGFHLTYSEKGIPRAYYIFPKEIADSFYQVWQR